MQQFCFSCICAYKQILYQSNCRQTIGRLTNCTNIFGQFERISQTFFLTWIKSTSVSKMRPWVRKSSCPFLNVEPYGEIQAKTIFENRIRNVDSINVLLDQLPEEISFSMKKINFVLLTLNLIFHCLVRDCT